LGDAEAPPGLPCLFFFRSLTVLFWFTCPGQQGRGVLAVIRDVTKLQLLVRPVPPKNDAWFFAVPKSKAKVKEYL